MHPNPNENPERRTGAGPSDPLAEIAGHAEPTEQPAATAVAEPRATDGARRLVGLVIGALESLLIATRGERWRIPADLRPDLIEANAIALDAYLPDFATGPLLPALGSLTLWIGSAAMAERAARPTNDTEKEGSAGSGPLDGEAPSAASTFITLQ